MDKEKQVVKSKTPGIFNKFRLWGKKKASAEITIDIDQQFELFTKVFKNLKNGKLYGKGRNGKKNKLVRYVFDERVRCADENQGISFNLDDKHKNHGMGKFKYIHVGAIMIAVKGLQRPSPGAKVFVVLYDTRFLHAEQGVIGTYEIDMSGDNGAIIYFCPNMVIDPDEFIKHIKVGIRTKGYDCQLLEGVENLIIRAGFIGNMCVALPSCKINGEEMGKMLVEKGIKAVPGGMEYTALEWNLEAFFEEEARERAARQLQRQRQNEQFASMFRIVM